MPHRSHAQVASTDEVRITRRGDVAVIEYADAKIPTARFTVGAERMAQLTDTEILELWNEGVEAALEHRAALEYVATEIPAGRPQIERSVSGAWVPRGTVLRCLLDGHVDGEDGRVFVKIDDQHLSLKSFANLLTIFEGWGMRIEFVPKDKLTKRPRHRVEEPKGAKVKSQSERRPRAR